MNEVIEMALYPEDKAAKSKRETASPNSEKPSESEKH
jgi:hypothetical protein